MAPSRQSRRTARERVLASLSLAAAAAGEWTLCDPTNTAYNSTRCPPWATCMANDYSLSSWGCAPFPNATVCLGSHFQACPANSACVLANGSGNATDLHNVYNCVAPGTGASLGKSRCSCKPGAPLPPSPTLKNVLIIGDSISLGYTPFLAAALADVALIQHAPWSSDGGSEETAYTLQCALPFWLSSPGGEPIAWDLVYAQSGMHNSGQGAEWIVPGQSGEPAAYAAELFALLASLRARAPLFFFFWRHVAHDVQRDDRRRHLVDAQPRGAPHCGGARAAHGGPVRGRHRRVRARAAGRVLRPGGRLLPAQQRRGLLLPRVGHRARAARRARRVICVCV